MTRFKLLSSGTGKGRHALHVLPPACPKLCGPTLLSVKLIHTKSSECLTLLPLLNSRRAPNNSKNDAKYGLIMQFLTPESELFKKRLDVTLNHIRCKSKKKSEGKVARRNRGHCVVCCENCDERSSNPGGKCKGIHGRKTVSYCAVCGVYVCNNCWDSFHLDEVPNLPPCTEKKLGLARRRILRYDDAPKKQTRSPVRAMRPTRNSSSLSSPSKASSRARYIGQKLLERQANKPDRLTAESPRVSGTASPLKHLHKMNDALIPRRKPILSVIERLRVWRPGEKRKRSVEEEPKTKATKAMTVVGAKRKKMAGKKGK